MAGSKIPIQKVCELCGQEFTAQKVSTRFCSHTCASRAYKQRKREERAEVAEKTIQKQRVQNKIEDFADRPYLKVSEASKLLSVARQTHICWSSESIQVIVSSHCH